MKDLKKLKGAKMLSKKEQQVIKGGKPCLYFCAPMATCCTPEDYCGTIGADGNCYAY